MKNTNIDKGSEKTLSGAKTNNVKMPKNLRQVGNINDTSKVIYVEDYVMSYIKQLSEKDQNESKIAILLGQYIYNDKTKNIFIKGAIEMDDKSINENDIFTDESWTNIYVNIKEYFADEEIIGWAIIGLSIMFDIEDRIKKIHKENFSGPDRVLLKYDCMEKEENLFIVENNQFIKQRGYYIYYEKNEEMQNYMIDHNHIEKTHEEYDDIATKKIRNVIEKNEIKRHDKNINRLTYAAGTLLAIIVILTASTMLRNYHQMKNLETALDSISQNLANTEKIGEAKEVISENKGDLENPPNGEIEEPGVEASSLDNTETGEEQSTMEGNGQNKGGNADNPEEVDVETVPGDVVQTPETTQSGETGQAEGTGPETVTSTEPEVTQPATTEASATEEIKYYIVRQGDSLASISNELYNDTTQAKLNEIIALNGIENQDKIYAGQQLIIP